MTNLETDINDLSILALRIKNLAIAATEIAMQPLKSDRMENDAIIFSITESIQHYSSIIVNTLDRMESQYQKA